MSPESELDECAVPYSFAVEYDGPPISHDLPRAVPIIVDKIPVARVVSANVCLPDKLSVPVVQPISASHIVKKLSKDVNLCVSNGSIVSPTSVIDLANESTVDNVGCGLSGEFVSSGEFSDVINGLVGIGLDNASVSPVCDVGTSGCGLSGEFVSSGEFSDVINSSVGVGSSSVSFDQSSELLAGIECSSGSLGFSNSFDKSREVSNSSLTFRASNVCKGSVDFSDLGGGDWVSSGSTRSFEYPSSGIDSVKNQRGNYESACDFRKNQVVTFRDLEPEEGDFCEDFSRSEPEEARGKREPRVKVKKGACYRCFKGSRFTEKEVCIVCSSKYCTNCVLRAMGSMPEGRKCVACIGYPIDESKRGSLGKSSRILKRLLNDLEVRQIMKAEKHCVVNQLPPDHVYVNGQPLDHEELVMLQNCSNPPKKLKPGRYWYDKVSGLWGKEGDKPTQIISPHLNVGGPIKQDASNGNTKVYINGREITKVELRMLQLAGVQCAGNPHFWVNDDGSYQEEGQKNTRGYIWGKAGTKLVCAVLSLPVPSKSTHTFGEQSSNVLSQTTMEYYEQRMLQKLLLIGCSGSGTSTIFKQAKILYKDIPFTEDERENIKLIIQTNVYGYLGILLEGRERFEDEALNEMRKIRSSDASNCDGNADEKDDRTIYSFCPRLKEFSDWLLKMMVSGSLEAIFPAATREYAPLLEELWNDAAIQATYKRRSELEMLPGASDYFLEQTARILRADYIPSDVDILYAERVTSSNGLACVEFSFPQVEPDDNSDAADQLDSMLRFQLIRVQPRGFVENCKWLEMFEDVRLVIFCVALNDYDQLTVDGDGNSVNKMLLSRKFFESIVTHPTYDQMDFLLILNKFDMFEEKIERVPVTRCDWFSDFRPVISRNSTNKNISSNNINHNPSLGQMASHFVAVKFKKLYESLTDRKLYVSVVKGLDPNSVDGALKYAKEIIKWDEERANFNFCEYSAYSTEPSSFSH